LARIRTREREEKRVVREERDKRRAVFGKFGYRTRVREMEKS